MDAEAALVNTTRQDAVLSVAVTTPIQGAAAQEITLPANTQAFIDTPIYARTSGYLRKWYADIGTRVHKGQLLAEIETPELDQQVRQAQSELSTAQANEQIAQITAERWVQAAGQECGFQAGNRSGSERPQCSPVSTLGG